MPPGATGSLPNSSTSAEPLADELLLVAATRRESTRTGNAQSYGEDTLTDGEKAFIDFLVDKAIEAWLKR